MASSPTTPAPTGAESATKFVSGADPVGVRPALGKGSYVAMESFEDSGNGKTGTFNLLHSAFTSGIVGTGGISVESDGTHRIWFEYRIGEQEN